MTPIAFLRRHPVTVFIVLAYAGSWVAWAPWWMSHSGTGWLPYQLPLSAVTGINQLGLLTGPLAAALLVTLLVDGRQGLRALLARFMLWRVHPVWYAVSLVLVPLAAGVGYLWTRGGPPFGEAADVSLVLLVTTFFVFLLGGPVQEEPGWRGFALPRLQRRLHPLSAALVLGVIHAFWHAPLFLTAEWDTARGSPGQYVAYLLAIVSLSVVLSWLVNGSRGSILLAVVGHNALNWSLFSVGALTGTVVASTWPAAVGLTVLAVLVVALTRGQLGLRPAAGVSRMASSGGPIKVSEGKSVCG